LHTDAEVQGAGKARVTIEPVGFSSSELVGQLAQGNFTPMPELYRGEKREGGKQTRTFSWGQSSQCTSKGHFSSTAGRPGTGIL